MFLYSIVQWLKWFKVSQIKVRTTKDAKEPSLFYAALPCRL